jgi:hypothetical protein
VQVPPTIEAKESGINSRDALSSLSLASFITIGRKTTTTGVLLMSAERGATSSMRVSVARSSLLPATLMKAPAAASIAPVRSRAALKMNMHATVTGALLLKTRSASSVRNSDRDQCRHRRHRNEVRGKPLPDEGEKHYRRER